MVANLRTRFTALRFITVVLLLLAALRMLTLVLHSPVVGYANQYDMLRSSACLDFWPGASAAKIADIDLEIATPKAPIPVYQHRVFDRSNCYWSADVALTSAALALHRMAIGGNDVDLRWIGTFKTALLLAAVVWLNALLWPHPHATALHALVAVLVLADPFVMLYANTLYTEFGAVLGAYLTIAGALSWRLSSDLSTHSQPDLRRQRRAIDALLLGLASLACARVPHAPLAVILAAVLLYFAWQAPRQTGTAQRQFPRALAVALLLPLILGSAVAARNQYALAGVAQANASNTLFFTVLPSAPDSIALAQALGLPAHCGELAFSSWYLRRETDVARDCPEAFGFSRARLAVALATHPKTALRLLANAFAQSRGWRVRYIGEQAGGDFVRAPFWSVADLAPRLPYPMYVWLTIFALCFGALGVANTKSVNSGALQISLALLIVALVFPLLISLMGDGYTELPRHAHLALVALVALLLVLAANAKTIGIRRFGLAAVMSGALSLTLFAQPAAIAAWDHPLKAHVGEHVAVSGWTLDAFGIVEIYAVAPGQVRQPLAFSHRAGVDSVFQGYPNSDRAGVKGRVLIHAPYTEIRVRNRLGVVTVVDRIWATVNPNPVNP